MHSYLQTKAVSLALEAKYIRKQELRFIKRAKVARRHNKDRSATWAERNRIGQYLHRIGIVRYEARHTNLARGFLCGKQYSEIELKAFSRPDWKKVEQLVITYAERDNPRWNQTVEELFKEWKTKAVDYFEKTNGQFLYEDSSYRNPSAPA